MEAQQGSRRMRIQRLVLEDLGARGIACTILTGTVERRAARVMQVLATLR